MVSSATLTQFICLARAVEIILTLKLHKRNSKFYIVEDPKAVRHLSYKKVLASEFTAGDAALRHVSMPAGATIDERSDRLNMSAMDYNELK